MLYVLQCLDRPGAQALRQQIRPQHLAFVGRRAQAFRFGGPLIGEDGTVNGSLMLLELPDRDALDRHMGEDPFFTSGLFQTVNVWQTRQVVPETAPGALAAEIGPSAQGRDPSSPRLVASPAGLVPSAPRCA
jgi:uncharacterized protein YciI